MKTLEYSSRFAPRINPFTRVLLICLIGAGTLDCAMCAVDAAADNANSIIERLRLATADRRKEIEMLTSELEAQGKAGVPMIKDASKREQGVLRAHLVRVLARIPDDEATDALVELSMQSSDAGLTELAYTRLENRVIRKQLTPEQMEMVSSRIEGSQVNAIRAGAWSRILSLCISNDPVKRAQPIVARLKIEIARASGESTFSGHGSYLSDEAVRINQFLVALANITNSVVSEQLQSERAQAKTKESRLWFAIAIGMARDPQVSEELKHAVESESNVSVRALALRAYSRSSGEKAKPFLQKFSADTTPFGEDITGKPLHPLQIVAKDELRRLGIDMEK